MPRRGGKSEQRLRLFQPTRVTRALSGFHQRMQFLLDKRSDVFVVSLPYENQNQKTKERIQSLITDA
jgi:hypothetical protein